MRVCGIKVKHGCGFFLLYYSSHIQGIFFGGGTHLNGLKSQFSPCINRHLGIYPLHCIFVTGCFDVQPAAHCDFLPAAELSVQHSLGSDVWRYLRLPPIVLPLKALCFCWTVGSALFLQIKRGCPRGLTAQGICFVKVLLFDTTPRMCLKVFLFFHFPGSFGILWVSYYIFIYFIVHTLQAPVNVKLSPKCNVWKKHFYKDVVFISSRSLKWFPFSFPVAPTQLNSTLLNFSHFPKKTNPIVYIHIHINVWLLYNFKLPQFKVIQLLGLG